MKHLFYSLLLGFICLSMGATAQRPQKLAIPRPKQDILLHNLSYPEGSGAVKDFESLFTIAQATTLDSLIDDFKKRTTIPVAIATLDESQCDKNNFDNYSLHLANAWTAGIKGKDNGVLIAISRQFRQMRIRNGTGITKVLSDEATKRIIEDNFIPAFNEGNYFKGTSNGLLQLMHILEKSYIPNSDCYQLYKDTTLGNELWGYKQAGQVKIPAKYLASYTPVFCDIAFVADKKEGWIGIDKNDSILLRPLVYDNGPDPVSDDLFRFVVNGKMGFANLKGEKIIPPRFDFVTLFSNGFAVYYTGGEKMYEDNKTRSQMIAEKGALFEDIHWYWGGNITAAGFTDTQGQMQDAVAYTNILVDLIAKNNIKVLEHLTTGKLYCYLCFSKAPENEPYVSRQAFYNKHFKTIFNKELIQSLQRRKAKVITGTADYGDILVVYELQDKKESGSGHEGVQLGFWLKAENGIFKISGVEILP